MARKKLDKLIKGIEAVQEDLDFSNSVSFGLSADLEIGSMSGFDKQLKDIAVAKLKMVLPRVEAKLANALNAAMSSSSWSWKGGSRDIVDTGALKNSLKIEWIGMTAVVSYSEPYAAIIHEGGYIYPYGNKSASPVYLPGRPWVKSVLVGGGPVPQFDWEEAIIAAL